MDLQQILTLSLQQALGPTAVIYALAAIGLNVHFGYTGLLNFGQAGFMMVAGYAFVSVSVIWGGSLWLGIPIAFVLTIITASAATYFMFEGMKTVERSVIRPITSEPTRAPNAVPKPPRVTAAKISSRMLAPVSHRSDW